MTLTSGERERACAFPPHPGPGDELAAIVTEPAWSRFRRWLRHAPAERVPLPSVPIVWTATEIMHTVCFHGVFVGAAAVAGTGLAYGRTARKVTRDSDPGRQGRPGNGPGVTAPGKTRMTPGEVAAVTAAAGGWVTSGTIWGPLAGPYHLLTLLYLAGSGAGYWWLRRHDAVRAARRRRDEAAAWEARKADWHRLASQLGLRGSHLLQYEDTLLGDTMLIDTRGTGRRASQVSGRDVAERLGEIEMIPAGRIDVTTDRLPGRLRISVRRKDPWAQALTHPAADSWSPYARYVTEPASIRKPLVIGADPETGEPLTLTIWDPDEGGKVIGVFAKKGSGKTVLLSCITERITACPDAQLLQVNLGKHREDRRWAPLAAANALGRKEGGRGRRILQWTVEAIEERSNGGDDARVTPTAGRPLYVVKIDEVDQVAADPVCQRLLDTIASKCRSEGFALIIAGQRATAQWMGGANLRANLDIAVLGRFARAGEARKATGEEVDLPDMGEYGEGRPGVFCITELGGGGGYERGRVFNLSDPAAIDKIVARRAADRTPHCPEAALDGLADLWARITRPGGDEDQDDGAGTASRPAGGRLIEGTEQITAKIGQARHLAGEDLELPEIPPEMHAHAVEQRAERRRQFFDQLTDVTIPDLAGSVLISLMAGPRGISTREAAAEITARTGKAVSYQTVFRWCQRLRKDGYAEVRGKGSTRRWHLTDAAVAGFAEQLGAAGAVAEGGNASPAPPVLRLVRSSEGDTA